MKMLVSPRKEVGRLCKAGKSLLAGFSLLELLISMFLTTLLLSALTQHFLVAKRQFRASETVLSQVLEEQLIEALIRDSVRSAGFTPCLYLDALNGLNAETRKPLSAIELETDAHGNSRLKNARMRATYAAVKEIRYGRKIRLDRSLDIRSGQVILIADCYHAEAHRVEAVYSLSDQPWIRLKHPLIFEYEPGDVYLGEWEEETYFIQKTQAGKTALFYQRDHAEELMPDVDVFSARILPSERNRLLQVKFHKEKRKEIMIETRVRAG